MFKKLFGGAKEGARKKEDEDPDIANYAKHITYFCDEWRAFTAECNVRYIKGVTVSKKVYKAIVWQMRYDEVRCPMGHSTDLNVYMMLFNRVNGALAQKITGGVPVLNIGAAGSVTINTKDDQYGVTFDIYDQKQFEEAELEKKKAFED